MAVVVLLPCVPATATPVRDCISSTQHLRVAQRADAKLSGPAQLGIVRRHGVAMDDQVDRLVDMIGIVTVADVQRRAVERRRRPGPNR